MEYEHTQHGKLHFLLYATSLVLIVIGTAIGHDPLRSLTVFLAAAPCLLLGVSLHTLTVKGEGDRLRIFSGPFPLFKKEIEYSTISGVKIARSSLLDGWGIHYGFGKGWIINIWGFDCVVLKLGLKHFRIGTDDPQGLYMFVKNKIGELGSGSHKAG